MPSLALFLGALICQACLASQACQAQAPQPAAPPIARRFELPTMGTVGSVQIVADSVSAATAAAVALGRFTHVDSLLSNWTSTSEVARVNAKAATGAQGTIVHPELATVLATALRVGRESEGAFDITVEPLVRLWGFLGGKPAVPKAEDITALLARIGWRQIEFDPATRRLRFLHPQLRIDLGGIAKGYAVDLAAQALRAAGIEHALVDISGNMFPLGHSAAAASWKVGVRDPQDRLPYFATLTLEQDAISTSGNYEQFVTQDGKQYGHILDPRSGWPVDELLQVTVLAPTAMEADAWSTALMVLGRERAVSVLRQHPELHAILVARAEGERLDVVCDARLQARFHLTAEAAPRCAVTSY